MTGACIERIVEKVNLPRALILGIHAAFGAPGPLGQLGHAEPRMIEQKFILW